MNLIPNSIFGDADANGTPNGFTKVGSGTLSCLANTVNEFAGNMLSITQATDKTGFYIEIDTDERTDYVLSYYVRSIIGASTLVSVTPYIGTVAQTALVDTETGVIKHSTRREHTFRTPKETTKVRIQFSLRIRSSQVVLVQGLQLEMGISAGNYEPSSIEGAIEGSVIPAKDDVYDVGSSTYNIKDIYMGGTIKGKDEAAYLPDGKNLIQHSAFWDINNDDLPVMWAEVLTPTKVIATSTLFAELGGKQITITGNGAALEGIKTIVGAAQATRLNVQPSTTYTFKVAYKVTEGDTGTLIIKSYAGAVASTEHINSGVFTSTTEKWYKYTFTTSATADNLLISFTATADGDVLVLAHPKLEQGAIATPYSLNEAEEQANIIQYYNCNMRAYAAADQDNIIDATWVQAVLGTEDYDDGADFASNQGIIPITGYYVMDGCVMFENTDAAADKQYGGAIYVDPLNAGSDAAIAYDWVYPALAGKFVSCRPHIEKKLNKTDAVNLWAFADTGGATQDIESGSANTSLSIRLVKLDI